MNEKEQLFRAIAFKQNLTVFKPVYKFILKHLPEKLGNKVYKNTLSVFLANLICAYKLDKEKYFFYSRSSNEYKKNNPRYNPFKVGYKNVRTISNTLIKEKFIEHKKGYYGRAKGRGKRSRARASKKLIAIFHQLDLKEKLYYKEQIIETIRLKDKFKRYIDYKDTEETNNMRYDLADYNNLLNNTFIGLTYPSKVKKYLKLNPINFKNRKYHRVFNNDCFEEGGRFYGPWYQQLPEEIRKYLIINNSPTIELDYGSLHIHLLYGKANENYYANRPNESDPYILKGFDKSERKLIKLIINIALNMKTKKNFKNNIKNTIEEEVYTDQEENIYNPSNIPSKEKIDKIINQFQTEHKPIANHLFTGVGIELQYTDSELARWIIKQHVNRDKPILCIHDSFIVRKSDKTFLEKTMVDSFKVFNLNSIPRISAK